MTNPSIEAYKTVCKVLGIKPARSVKVPSQLTDMQDATLVIVPDALFDHKQIIALAEKFGEDQPHKTWIYEDLYKLYSPEELSGRVLGTGYRMVYIPKEFNVPSGTVAEQKRLAGHVPTVLEAICHWYTLRAAGDKLNDNTAFDKTYIRHFDMKPQRLDGWLRVPCSCVNIVGGPFLGDGDAGNGVDARLAVGYDLDIAPPLVPSVPLPDKLEINGVTYVREV